MPRKNSKFHQGVIDPNALKKYYTSCKADPVIYRSGLEWDFIQFCEHSPGVVRWASEPINIRYANRLSGTERNYYPDYVLETDKGERMIVEIKPYSQTVKPKATDSRWLKETWVQNTDKWAAAKAFAEDHGMKFVIITERFFKK